MQLYLNKLLFGGLLGQDGGSPETAFTRTQYPNLLPSWCTRATDAVLAPEAAVADAEEIQFHPLQTKTLNGTQGPFVQEWGEFYLMERSCPKRSVWQLLLKAGNILLGKKKRKL